MAIAHNGSRISSDTQQMMAKINNVGVFFEILGMVVFAFILALFHNHQGVGVVFKTGGTNGTVGLFLVAMFMSHRRGVRGYLAVSRGLIAIGAGDASAAKRVSFDQANANELDLWKLIGQAGVVTRPHLARHNDLHGPIRDLGREMAKEPPQVGRTADCTHDDRK